MFLENFSESLVSSIRDDDTITSLAGDHKLGFISAEDIADVAVKALTDEKSHDTDHIIVGPELLSYGEVSNSYWFLYLD